MYYLLFTSMFARCFPQQHAEHLDRASWVLLRSISQALPSLSMVVSCLPLSQQHALGSLAEVQLASGNGKGEEEGSIAGTRIGGRLLLKSLTRGAIREVRAANDSLALIVVRLLLCFLISCTMFALSFFLTLSFSLLVGLPLIISFLSSLSPMSSSRVKNIPFSPCVSMSVCGPFRTQQTCWFVELDRLNTVAELLFLTVSTCSACAIVQEKEFQTSTRSCWKR